MERYQVIMIARRSLVFALRGYGGPRMSKPKYNDVMRDWEFWMSMAKDLGLGPYGLRASETQVAMNREVVEAYERVFEALCEIRRERSLTAFEHVLRGATMRQAQRLVGGISASVVRDEVNYACNRLLMLVKSDVELLELTL